MRNELIFGFFILFCAAAGSSQAALFETKQGKSHEGEILEEDGSYLYVDTSSGVININKADIKAVDGEPYHYAASEAAPVHSKPAARPAGQSAAGQTAAPPWPPPRKQTGYLSQADRDLANLPKPLGNQPAYFAGSMTNEEAAAIDAASMKTQNAGAAVHPSGVTERELETYYAGRKEEFRMPVQIRFKFLNALTLKGDPAAIVKNPASTRGWQDSGWMKKGETFNAPFQAGTLERIFSLKKGEAVHIPEAGGYVFWAVERKESYVMPYEEARPKVLTKVLQKKVS